MKQERDKRQERKDQAKADAKWEAKHEKLSRREKSLQAVTYLQKEKDKRGWRA